MKIDILTLFPRMFEAVLSESILKRAQAKGLVEVRVHDIRDWATDKHRTCDDRPFGGGPGMVLKPEPIDRAFRAVLGARKPKGARTVLLSPGGAPFTQEKAERLARVKRLVLLSGRYEGVDERVSRLWIDEEISIGDYVLTGGELPAMVVTDAVARLVPGVLGNAESKNFESFAGNLLEYPHYTRPVVFRGLAVPPVLLSGNHSAIETWRRAEALKRTRERRPDLLGGRGAPGPRAKKARKK
jgi:tRNA (guanine37-N1)-methyltransferase